MIYVFKKGGAEIEFTADSDSAAWRYVIENHSVSRDRAMPSETLYRVERVPVERPAKLPPDFRHIRTY